MTARVSRLVRHAVPEWEPDVTAGRRHPGAESRAAARSLVPRVERAAGTIMRRTGAAA